MNRVLNLIPRRVLLASMFIVFSLAEAHGQGEVKIKNTAKQIKPGIYECIIYLDISKGLVKTIDDVHYTLPPGYPDRKKRARKNRPGVNGYFSSDPFITTEEATVDVLIDYKGPKDAYLNYKLKLFQPAIK